MFEVNSIHILKRMNAHILHGGPGPVDAVLMVISVRSVEEVEELPVPGVDLQLLEVLEAGQSPALTFHSIGGGGGEGNVFNHNVRHNYFVVSFLH
jgi:hypothetical protein